MSTSRLTEESSPLLTTNLFKPLGEPIEVYETQYFEIEFTCYWTPPAPEKPICVWAVNLPGGSSFPTASGYGSVSSTFSWQPTYCQAGSYAPVFYCGESCGSPLLSDTADINVIDVNRHPVIESWNSPINIKEGETLQRGINSVDLDYSQCHDDHVTLNYNIVPTPTLASTFMDFENGTALFRWTTSPLDIGSYNLTFDAYDTYGSHSGFTAKAYVEFDQEKIKNITTGSEINITYEGVCTENCTKIVFIQVVCRYVELNNGSKVSFKPGDMMDTWKGKNADTVDGGKWCTVDYMTGESDPYYNGDIDDADSGEQGKHNAVKKDSKMTDDPSTADKTIENLDKNVAGGNLKKVIKEFETCVFCAEGKDKGKYYGCINWKYERSKGESGNGKSTATSTTAASSAKFKDAVDQWSKNHKFTMPK